MKKFNKNTNIVLTVVIGLFLVLGFIFSFVPVKLGSNTFVSFGKSINVSSDLKGGMYGEYTITTKNVTETQLTNSMKRIKEVFEQDGYKNVNVYAVSNTKLRVEVSYATGSKTYSDVHEDLTAVASGKFMLSTDSDTTKDGAKNLVGSECVSEVKVYTNNDVKYISIIFNDKGVEQFKAVCNGASSSQIYMHLGTYYQQISISSGISDYSNFTLSDSDYENLIALQKRVVVGCMDVELVEDINVINTMSASLSTGSSSASSPADSGFACSAILVVLFACLLCVMVAIVALFAVRFGLFAVVVALSMVFNVYFFTLGFNLIPSAEIGLAGMMSLILGVSVIYTYTYIYASKVKSEYEVGKSFSASLESAFKKTFANTIVGNVALLITSLVVFAFAFGEVSSAVIVFTICVALSLITNFGVVPLFVKIGISYDKIGIKLFMLKKRSLGFASQTENEVKTEEEV